VLVRSVACGVPRAGACAGALLLTSALVAAQSPAPAAPPADQAQAVFRAGIDVVRLDIRVTDDSGKPITNLRPSEVQVVDSGTRQPVVLFQHIEGSGRNANEARQRTIAAEISTNQGAPRGQLYVLVFDQQHITSGAEQRVRHAAETFLRQRVTPEDRVAVYGLPGPGPALPFTRDVNAAIAQLRIVRGSLQRTLTPGERDMTVNEAYEILRGNEAVLTRFMTVTGGTPDRTGVLPDVTGKSGGGSDSNSLRGLIRDQANLTVQNADAESRRFLDMMSQLLRTFRGVDGRKTVMLFSEGFHSDNISRSIDEVAAAAAETYSVVYAFDLNRRTDNLTASLPQGGDTASEISNRLEPMNTLASDTNGKVILDASTHLDQALDDLGDAELDYYIVGFPAPQAALANRDEYRHVSVRVNRPGAHVSARTGYVAGPAPSAADRRRAIEAALHAPFTQQGLRVEYTTYVGQSEHSGFQGVAVSLESELPVAAPSANDAFADVVFVVNDVKTGQVLANGSDRIALPHQTAVGSVAGLGTWRTRFDLPAGDYVMRCVVREPGGMTGSADRQFSVRSLGGPDAAATDLILGTPGERLPVRTLAYADEVLGGAVRVFGRSEAQLAGLTATLDLLSLSAASDDGAERAARTVRGSVSDSHLSDQGGITRDVAFTVPLADLPAGDYVAHVIVRAGGELVADRRRQVSIANGARPAPPVETASDEVIASSATARRPRDILKGNVVKEIVDEAGRSDISVVHQAAAEASSGRWSRALAMLGPAPATDPGASQLRALAHIDSEDYAGAVSDLGETFRARPADARMAFVLGWANVGAGNDVAAASAFRSAAFLDPALVPAHLALAETYMRLNQPALAAQALEAGLAKLPQSLELKRMLESIKR
jgi:VWFA-related protein